MLQISTHIASFVSKVLTHIIESRPKENIVEFLEATVERLLAQSTNTSTENNTIGRLREEKQFRWKQNNNTKDHESSKLNDINKGKPIVLVFLLVGLGGSGKTTLVSVLKGQNNPKCKPSLGFRPISLKYKENITIKLYDVGGGEKIRNIWNNYYHDVHGVIYIVDSSSDGDFDETISVAKSTLGHKYLQGKPLLVISNKVDKSESKPVHMIREKMNIIPSKEGMSRILATSIHPALAKFGGTPDPNIENALEWLIQKSLDNIEELDERIFIDSKEMKAIRKKKQEEKERRVFKTSLCKAFALNGEKCANVLGQIEAQNFLANEIGLSDHLLLPPQGKEVCSLVGYQRFALMIVGGMVYTNKARQEKPYSWSEVLSYVHSVRRELNLSDKREEKCTNS